MKIFIFYFALCISQALIAQDYNSAMQEGLNFWQTGNSDKAIALFERIAIAEPQQWLPDYYVGLLYTLQAFKTEDEKIANEKLKSAEKAIQNAFIKTDENAELLVLQALWYTAKISQNPMQNGQKYMPKVNQLYAKAEVLDPENPRVKFQKAQFEMGSAKFFGNDIQPMCDEIKASISLFENFKNDEPFYPNWGKKQAEILAKQCDSE
ncbi:hypothetical protein [Zunongwangia sp.]|uniref:hypothetical protein n=1 Tax=Zunongwangia sp. TaxID=1965325 RepID=UPI003AA86EC0